MLSYSVATAYEVDARTTERLEALGFNLTSMGEIQSEIHLEIGVQSATWDEVESGVDEIGRVISLRCSWDDTSRAAVPLLTAARTLRQFSKGKLGMLRHPGLRIFPRAIGRGNAICLCKNSWLEIRDSERRAIEACAVFGLATPTELARFMHKSYYSLAKNALGDNMVWDDGVPIETLTPYRVLADVDSPKYAFETFRRKPRPPGSVEQLVAGLRVPAFLTDGRDAQNPENCQILDCNEAFYVFYGRSKKATLKTEIGDIVDRAMALGLNRKLQEEALKRAARLDRDMVFLDPHLIDLTRVSVRAPVLRRQMELFGKPVLDENGEQTLDDDGTPVFKLEPFVIFPIAIRVNESKFSPEEGGFQGWLTVYYIADHGDRLDREMIINGAWTRHDS